MGNGMGNVGYNDVLTEGKWNMGAFIFQQMNDDMIKMAEHKDNNDFMKWFKRYKTLHNKIKATLNYFDEKNVNKIHQKKIILLDNLRSRFIDGLSQYNNAIENNNDTLKRQKLSEIVGLIEELEQTTYGCMPHIGAWLPTKKSFGSWEDELDADYG